MTGPADTGPQVAFRPLTRDDLELLTTWLNTPHVAEWWSDTPAPPGEAPTPVTLAQTVAEYGPDLDGGTTHQHVILADGAPVGMIQWYRLADEPVYATAVQETGGDAAAVDVLIGDPARVGRGLGPRVIDRFVTEVVFAAGVDRVVASPAAGNHRSIVAFARAGFRSRRDVTVPGEPRPEHVMVRSRDEPSS
jgi:aminoglycoside 6'-N-acetyltransferase